MTSLRCQCSFALAAFLCLAAGCSRPSDRVPPTFDSTNSTSLWSFSTGATGGHEAAPLVVGSTMYVVTPYPNFLHALDLTRPGAPPKWTYKPVAIDATTGTVTTTPLPVLPVHEGQPLAPHDLWSAWSWEPAVVVSLVLSLWLYLRGIRAIWRSAGSGHGIRTWEAAAFVAGWIALAVALISPLHQLGGVLFSAHMAQHELLMVVAAPLLVLGRPIIPFLWALPMSWRRVLGAWSAAQPVSATWILLTTPLVAWLLHGIAVWVWHAPVLYQGTLGSETIHTLQHASFLITALLFWWALLHGREGRPGRPAAVIYLFTTSVHTSLLGALLTFSSGLWYPLYEATTLPWGLTPLEDQQLAGVIMWVPAGVAYLVATLGLAATWLGDPTAKPLLESSSHQ